MFLISKMIFDPTNKMLKSNRMGRTIGFVLRTPKFFKCQKYDFYISQFDELRDSLDDETMEHRYQSKLAHQGCTHWWSRFNRSHLSYRGYLYFIGPKRRYQFHYMGDINRRNSNPRWGYVRKHDHYVRWFDNGPQSPPTQIRAQDIEMLREHHDRFTKAMYRSRLQMEEYERTRSGGSR